MMTFEDETGIESRDSRSLLPGYCLKSPALSSVYNHQLSPADTVRDYGDGTRYTPAEFRLSQCFGDYSTNGEVAQADTLSTVQFDSSGKYLATGDRGGRVVIFRKTDDGKIKETPSGKMRRTSDFKFFTEFQSHEAEFDYLKSLDIQRKINAIKWCPRINDALFVLSTNDKTVKLWKVREKKVKTFACAGQRSIKGGRDKSELVLPNMSVTGTTIASSLRRTFANGHAYHINSIDPSSDGEHFISADDLRINLWNLNVIDRSFNILDMKPKSMEELTEVITAATFHPSHSNVFLYSSSRGCIKIGDMRAAALCDQHAKVLDKSSDVPMKSFFSEIVASISDIKMTSDGRYIFSRDYMTLKLWDVNMEARPLKIINVHEHLRPKLCDLYNKDYIFDKFECAINKDASAVVTGTYGNKCNLYDRNGQSMEPLEVCKEATTTGSKKAKRQFIRYNSQQALIANGEVDYEKKILHMSWHPTDDIIAVAGKDKLFIYDGTS